MALQSGMRMAHGRGIRAQLSTALSARTQSENREGEERRTHVTETAL